MKIKDLENKTKTELLEIAQKLDITGRSLLNKDKLIKKIEPLLLKKKKALKPKIKRIKTKAKKVIKAKEKSIKKDKKLKIIPPKKENIRKGIKKEIKPLIIDKFNDYSLQSYEEPRENQAYVRNEVFHEKFHEEIPRPEEIPDYYGEDKLVLQVRDPYWAHAYWEITPNTETNIQKSLGDKLFNADKVMRIYDVTDIVFNGSNAWSVFDLFIGNANNWYVHLGASNRSYFAEIGYLTKDGKFYPLVRSNTIRTPSDGPSSIIDEEWMILEDKFREMYALSGGGRSAIGSPMFKEIFEKRWLLWNLSSEGLSVFSKSKE